MKLFLKSFILILLVISIKECKRKEDKLVLQPKELVNLNKEEINKESFDIHRTHDKEHEIITTSFRPSTYITDDELPMDQDFDDEDALNSRKIWSRWSKWSECSVSCGRGAIVRHRMCVSGRCSPHELEEQRRLCHRPPCDQHLFPIEEQETK